MIPLLTREAVRAIDAKAVALGLPSIVLMENAGRGATEAILARFGDRLERVVIAGGPGQNGGDGWVVARHLRNLGHTPVALLLADESKVKGDARVNLDAARALGIDVRVVPLDDLRPLEAALGSATLVVDALFGTGLDRELGGGWAAVVERLNAASAPRVALDLPSGVDANSGAVLGTAVRAALTVTFAEEKRGLHQYPGAALAGEVVRVSIGVPPSEDTAVALVTDADVAALYERRAGDVHKGTSGHVLCVAGSPGRTGAALLSGLGALRGGAGLVTLAARGEARAALDRKVVELMTAELPEHEPNASRVALEIAGDKRAAVVGPGLGLDPDGRSLAIALARALPIPAVLDADALTAIAEDGALASLRTAAAPRVLTPHPGEAGRLLGSSSAAVQADRYTAAARLAAESGQLAVLKGARTIVASPDGRMRVCGRGTPALATAGTGDVLSGALAAALLGEGDPLELVAAAVHLHAFAGELAARSDRGLLAHEVADALPLALERCRSAQ